MLYYNLCVKRTQSTGKNLQVVLPVVKSLNMENLGGKRHFGLPAAHGGQIFTKKNLFSSWQKIDCCVWIWISASRNNCPDSWLVLLMLQNVNNDAASISLSEMRSGYLLLQIVWSFSFKLPDSGVFSAHSLSPLGRKLDWLHKSWCKVQTEPKVWSAQECSFQVG